MRVLFLSTHDILGGAAIAAYRLFRCVCADQGVTARMIVQHKSSSDPYVQKPDSDLIKLWAHVSLPLEKYLLQKRYRNAKTANFMPARMPDGLIKRIERFAPDILHIHWVGHSFLKPETLSAIKCPVIWTMHDMWTITGGCYFDGGCGKYAANCGCCPVLGSNFEADLSRSVLQRKRSALDRLDLTLVSPSNWLASCARNSSLHANRRIEIIPYAVDPAIFQPWPKNIARSMLGLPREKKLVLFGALGIDDPRKGLVFLQAACRELSKQGCDFQIVVFGGDIQTESNTFGGIKVHSLGQIRDERSMALAYAATDIFVAPSIEDNLPNTILEALMCGTPVVAFKVGGICDLVCNNQNGFLVDSKNSVGLAHAIDSLLKNDEKRLEFGVNARRKAEMEFSLNVQKNRYMLLYQDVLSKNPK